MSVDFTAGGRLEVRITPSDVGKRVSVRRITEIGDGRPVFSDAVGVLTSWDQGVLVVTRRDGETVPHRGIVAGGRQDRARRTGASRCPRTARDGPGTAADRRPLLARAGDGPARRMDAPGGRRLHPARQLRAAARRSGRPAGRGAGTDRPVGTATADCRRTCRSPPAVRTRDENAGHGAGGPRLDRGAVTPWLRTAALRAHRGPARRRGRAACPARPTRRGSPVTTARVTWARRR